MMNAPSWLKPIGVAVAVLLVALFLAGELGVVYRGVKAPEGYDQSRLHWNTKNTTRFSGANADDVATQISRAVYPATDATNTPSVVILYDPTDWQGGLAAASLLRPLNAVLLPAGGQTASDLERLQPQGSEALNGAQVLLINDADAPPDTFSSQQVTTADVPELLEQLGVPPLHAVIVSPDDPATALLAAPWAAYSGDLIVFNEADAPADLPRYALGDVTAEDAVRIDGGSPAVTAVKFAKYEDPENPLFGWGMQEASPTGYRAYTLARSDDPAMALQSANLARRGKIGPLLWANERDLPAVVNDYLWSQRPAFYTVPNAGPFHHFWVLGDTDTISFPTQGQADYAVEIGPYRLKGAGASGLDMLSSVWVALGIASALWIAFHSAKFLPQLSWIMRLAWPLLALMVGPFGIPFYVLAYNKPVMQHGKMTMWDRPLWIQGLVATASAVGFGGALMVATGWVMTLFGLPLISNHALGPFFWLGAPMVLVMIANYVVAVLVSWPLYQTPMIAMFHGLSYAKALPKALPIVLASMASVSLAMFPAMWWLMMLNISMMPDEESILWFGVMFFTVFLGFLISWPFNYAFVRKQQKSGMM